MHHPKQVYPWQPPLHVLHHKEGRSQKLSIELTTSIWRLSLQCPVLVPFSEAGLLQCTAKSLWLVKANDHLLALFSIAYSVPQEMSTLAASIWANLCHYCWSWTFERASDLNLGAEDLYQKICVNITVIVMDITLINVIGTTLRDCQAVAGVKIDPEKSVSLLLNIWNNVTCCWLERPVKLLGASFALGLQSNPDPPRDKVNFTSHPFKFDKINTSCAPGSVWLTGFLPSKFQALCL